MWGSVNSNRFGGPPLGPAGSAGGLTTRQARAAQVLICTAGPSHYNSTSADAGNRRASRANKAEASGRLTREHITDGLAEPAPLPVLPPAPGRGAWPHRDGLRGGHPVGGFP